MAWQYDDNFYFNFNFQDDPFEYTNIADQNPEVVTKMMERLKEYWLTMIPADVGNDVEEGNPIHFNGTFSPGFCESEPIWSTYNLKARKISKW